MLTQWDAYVNSILHCVLTFSATWAWADVGGGHPLADKKVPPSFAFFGDFMIIEVLYRSLMQQIEVLSPLGDKTSTLGNKLLFCSINFQVEVSIG